MKISKIWKKINDETFIFSIDDFEYTKASILSKTSRNLFLEDFLCDNSEKQLEEFNKSINTPSFLEMAAADLTNISVFSRGFGWISSWIIKDDPLFNGQEISTRSINIIEKLSDICFDAPLTTLYFHIEYSKIFSSISSSYNDSISENHPFDEIRWCLPGTLQTSTSIFMTAKILFRHLNKISNLDFMNRVVKNYMSAIEYTSPYIYESLQKRKRILPFKFEIDQIKAKKQLDLVNIKLKSFSNSNVEKIKNNLIETLPKRNKFQQLSIESNDIGIFHFKIYCSILSARSFHRHRAVMPWKIKLLLKNNLPFLFNEKQLLKFKEHKKKVKLLISDGYKFVNNNVDSLYHLPLGTAVQLECYGTLSNILYMLELRSFSLGGNKEYAIIANKGIKELKKILGEKFCNHFGIEENCRYE